MSVGLQVVRLLYGLYVFGHLSKWFTFLFLVPVSLSGCVVLYTCSQQKSIGDVAAIALRQPYIVQKLNSSITVDPLFVSRHNANAMLPAVLFVGLYVPSYAVQYSTVISNFVAFKRLNVLSCENCFKLSNC